MEESSVNHLYMGMQGDTPALVVIKGHKLLLLSSVSEDLEEELSMLGADGMAEIEYSKDKDSVLADLAAQVGGGIVIAPPGTRVGTMLYNLQQQLPWVN